MKNFLLSVVLIFLFSCATVNNNKNVLNKTLQPKTDIALTLKSLFQHSSESPDSFALKFPSSPIIINNIIEFYKTYPEKVIADNVTDFAIGKDEIAFITNHTINLINNSCNSFIFRKFLPVKVKYSDNVLAVYSKKSVKLFDLTTCNEFFNLQLEKSYFDFSRNYYFVSNGKDFKIYKYGMLIPLIKGKLVYKLVNSKFIGNTLKILDAHGQILTFNLKKLTLENIIRTGFKTVKGVIGEDFYIILTDNNSLIFKGKNLGKFKGSLLFSQNSPFIFAENTFLNLFSGEKYPVSKKVKSFGTKSNFILYLNKKELFVISSKKLYKEKIIFRTPDLQCHFDNNSVFIKDLDSEIIKINDNISQCYFENGNFINKGKSILYKFAKKIKEKNGLKMYIRKKRSSVYYFFSKN